MKCKKCGKTYNVNLLSCPYCGYEEDNKTNIETNNEVNTLEEDNNSSMFPILMLLVIICIIGSLIYISFNKNEEDQKEQEFLQTQKDNTIKYREQGYSISEIGSYKDLDNFKLINENYNYVDTIKVDNDNINCNNEIIENTMVIIENGNLIIKDKNNSSNKRVVTNISEPKFVTSFTNDGCSCNEINYAVITHDGEVYLFKSDNLKYKDQNDFIDKVSKGFKKIETENAINGISVTNYVGKIAPCNEKVLLMVDTLKDEYVYYNDEVISTKANYSTVIYNVVKINDDNYSIFINPDRTMQIGIEYDENDKYITDSSNYKIKYSGIIIENDSKVIYILSTDGILYSFDLSKDLSTVNANSVKGQRIKNYGYKFDNKDMLSKTVLIYEDGSSKEFAGKYETHGVFNER